MDYSGNTPLQQKEMLEELGLKSVEELFSALPEEIKFKRSLNLPKAVNEMALNKALENLAKKNKSAQDYSLFLGGGYYDHFVPAAIKHLLQRSEFYTAYTPYQAEASQGTLQAIYEYQSFITLLTGMEVSNASGYDGASVLSEAVFMAARIKKQKTILVSRTIHPEYFSVLKTCLAGTDLILKTIPHQGGSIDIGALKSSLNQDVGAVILAQPNFFGVFEEGEKICRLVKENGSIFIVSVDPIALGIVSPPGEWGADIVVGEGQALGSGLNFGGPGLGFIACRKEFIRNMPGRLVGKTTDRNGRVGYVLTLQTREQHIRRGKATSNICSNHALNALAAAIYLALLGPGGLKKVGELSLQKAHYARQKIARLPGYKLKFQKPFFKEFAVETPCSIKKINRKLLENKIIGGLDLEFFYPELKNTMLLAVTEKRTREEIDKLIEVLKNV